MENTNCEDIFSNTTLDALIELKQNNSLIKTTQVRYDWSQTDEHVFLAMYRKNVQKDNVLYLIKKSNIFLLLKISENEIFIIEDELFQSVIPQHTDIQISPMKVEVSFKKEHKGQKWTDLMKSVNSKKVEKKEDLLNPFSGKSSEEWNKLANAIKENEEDDTNGNIDTFFKKIYEEGDADVKRAMIKSFQTSNGTVLSTNWKDVANKNYEKEQKNCKHGN